MILLKSKLSARQTRTFIRDNITTVINEQQLKRTQEVCTVSYSKTVQCLCAIVVILSLMTRGGGTYFIFRGLILK